MVRILRHQQSDAERQSNSLAGLALTLLLVVVGLYLIETLRLQASLQDCVLSGRVACEVSAAP